VNERDMLRHTVATLAYRGGKVLRDAPPGFESFAGGPGTRTPGQILAHIGDLLDWALQMARGQHVWKDGDALPWPEGTARFFAGLEALDGYLDSDQPLRTSAETLFQGPIADALTHVGQIAMLRRMAGSPVRGENYQKADVTVGRVGPDQPPPNKEFD
jgi:hypothetical protein